MKFKKLKFLFLVLLVLGLSFLLFKDYEVSHEDHNHNTEGQHTAPEFSHAPESRPVADTKPHTDHEHSSEHEEKGEGKESHEHEHEGEEEVSGGVGADKAITEADPHVGLKLSEKTIQIFNVKTTPVGTSPFTIPVSGLVYFQEEIGVYRQRENWFKLIKVKLLSKSKQQVVLESSEVKAGDQIVIQGNALLRVAELDAFSAGEEGHGH